MGVELAMDECWRCGKVGHFAQACTEPGVDWQAHYADYIGKHVRFYDGRLRPPEQTGTVVRVTPGGALVVRRDDNGREVATSSWSG